MTTLAHAHVAQQGPDRAMDYFCAVHLDFDKSIQSHAVECVDKVQVCTDGNASLLLYGVQFVFTCGVLSIWYVCFIYSYINILKKKKLVGDFHINIVFSTENGLLVSRGC